MVPSHWKNPNHWRECFHILLSSRQIRGFWKSIQALILSWNIGQNPFLLHIMHAGIPESNPLSFQGFWFNLRDFKKSMLALQSSLTSLHLPTPLRNWNTSLITLGRQCTAQPLPTVNRNYSFVHLYLYSRDCDRKPRSTSKLMIQYSSFIKRNASPRWSTENIYFKYLLLQQYTIFVQIYTMKCTWPTTAPHNTVPLQHIPMIFCQNARHYIYMKSVRFVSGILQWLYHTHVVLKNEPSRLF